MTGPKTDYLLAVPRQLTQLALLGSANKATLG